MAEKGNLLHFTTKNNILNLHLILEISYYAFETNIRNMVL